MKPTESSERCLTVMDDDLQASLYREFTIPRSGNWRMTMGNPPQPDYTPPSVEHLGETARQFDWLKDETQAMAAVIRGFGRIVDNVRAIDPETSVMPKKPEPQRMTFTRKGKKRKMKKR